MKRMYFFSLFAIALFACTKRSPYQAIEGFTQGTTYRIVYQGEQNYRHEVDSILKAFDRSLSTYNPQSVITRINQNDPEVVADKHFENYYFGSRDIWFQTNGAFDITVAPIVKAWGFAFGDSANVNAQIIDSLLHIVGMDKVSYTKGRVIKQDRRIMFDSNAIAQGQSVDVVSDFLKSEGIVNYLVEIGGEVKAEGKNDKGKTWRIGVDKPIDDPDAAHRELQAVVSLENRGLATSGNYRKFYIKDGIKYSHTIDPVSGYPVNHSLLSATVLAPDCMTADGYATAFMVMGFEGAQAFVASKPELDVYLIADDGKGGYRTFMSEGMKNCIKEID